MHNVVLSSRNIDDFIKDIANEVISRIAEHPIQTSKKTTQAPEDLATRAEALKYLRITGATLWRWEKQGKVKSYGMGGKRYYRLSELEQSINRK